ncbi:PP2C family protein-serine/threonine phosphatase [Cryptosporangium sp. NPDC048952]|uniref:PP2C family protein-serine/threonine phosphatase n=1 Tax=Cryptosporangium sp. NPDC048952 TaxID=3363961 RepID=UPI00371FE5AA
MSWTVTLARMFEEPTAQGIREPTGFLSHFTKHLLGILTIEDIANRSLIACVPRIARSAQLLVPSRHGFRCLTAGPIPGQLSIVDVPRPVTGGPLSGQARVLSTGVAEVVPAIGDDSWVPGFLDAKELVVLPLTAHGCTFGTLTLADTEPVDDPGFLSELADRVALAADSALAHVERADIADAVDARRAANVPPRTPGMALASRVRRGVRPNDFGGDFLDVIGIPDDWVVLLGDVIPCRLPTPLLSLQARDVVHGGSRFQRRPAELLRVLNTELTDQPAVGARLLSALCARARAISPDTLIVSLASAGHPPPLVVRSSGGIHEVDVRGRLCGALASTSYDEIRVELHDRDMLLLVSDGVTDAKGSEDRFGVSRLARLAAAYRGATPAALAEAVDIAVTEFTAARPGRPTDDAAVVVIAPEPR